MNKMSFSTSKQADGGFALTVKLISRITLVDFVLSEEIGKQAIDVHSSFVGGDTRSRGSSIFRVLCAVGVCILNSKVARPASEASETAPGSEGKWCLRP